MSTLTDLMILRANASEVDGTNMNQCAPSSVGRTVWNAGKRLLSSVGSFLRTVGEAYWSEDRDSRSARHSPYAYMHVRGIL